MDFKPQKSVEWYDPKQLANTGIKAVISGIFGNFNDKREIQAALYQDKDRKSINCHKIDGDLWIDYISDTGDGFDATYTMATLLAQEKLEIDGEIMPRADVLIMGGDQVYPIATREEYKNRLQGPYETAYPTDEQDKNGDRAPKLFAIPGNHDWYDGLTTFIKIFCQNRSIGNWRTRQTRSYFALRLRPNLWLFGIDVQLGSDVDFNQIQYFEKILQEEVDNGGKIILCTAEPAWVYSTSAKQDSYNNLRHFEKNIIGSGGKFKDKKLKTILTISGDLHHYSRYTNEGTDNDRNERITTGGGGAFMHPTHNLPPKITKLYDGDFTLKSTFPSASDSRNLIWKNLLFPFMNKGMSFTLGIVYAFATWIFFAENAVLNALSFSGILKSLLVEPGLIFLLILITAGLTVFTNDKPYNPKFSSGVYYFFGFLHGAFHTTMILLCIYLVPQFMALLAPISSIDIFWIAATVWLFGCIVGGLSFGLYLTFCNLALGNHDNEAYSSLKIEGYKNFLRMRISRDTITIYPIGVKKIAHWKPSGQNAKPPFTTSQQAVCQLIEPPIHIRL